MQQQCKYLIWICGRFVSNITINQLRAVKQHCGLTVAGPVLGVAQLCLQIPRLTKNLRISSSIEI